MWILIATPKNEIGGGETGMMGDVDDTKARMVRARALRELLVEQELRRLSKQGAVERAVDDSWRDAPPPPWLHGWPRTSHTTVLIGTGVFCLGCGADQGIATVAFPEGWQPPGPEPAWPFPQGPGCPICALSRLIHDDAA